jgi:hypothetical protein
MTFAHPMLLAAGLGAITLPILIHILMRRRRRPTRWAAMRFLLEAYQRQRQRVRFEQWLLLLARCLIVALAALAIARPVLPGADPLLGSRATTMYLVLDNSIASAHGSPAALEAQKDLAIDLLERLDPLRGDRAALVTLGAPAQAVVVPATSVIQSVVAAVRQTEATDSAADVHGALARLAAEVSQDTPPGARTLIVLLSEFRAGSAPIERPLPAVGEGPEIALAAPRPATEPLDNVALTSVEPLQPIVLGASDTSTTQVRLRATRFGAGVAAAAEVPVELLVSERDAVARGTLVFEAGSREAVTALGVDGAALGDLRRDGPGPVVLTARLTTPDQLLRDNTRRAVIDRRASLAVGLVAPRRFGPRPSVSDFQAADWIGAALDPEALREGSAIRVQPVAPAAVDASTLAGLEAVIVAEPQGVTPDGWMALRRFADLGGLVVLFPQPGEGAQLWTDAAINAFDLAWELPREAIAIGEPRPAGDGDEGPAPPPDQGDGDGGTAAEQSGDGSAGGRDPGSLRVPDAPSPLLAMIEGELPELLRPIRVGRALPLTVRADSGQRLLMLGDGRTLAAAAIPGSRGAGAGAPEETSPLNARGLVVYVGLAMDLDWSDLPTKPLLLPLVQEVVRQGVSAAGGGGVVAAGSFPIASPGAVELAWSGVGAAPGGATPIPLHPSGVARQPIRHAGVYRGVDAAGASRGLVLVNPDTAGSDTEPRAERDVAAWLETAGAGQPIWMDPTGPRPGPGAADAVSTISNAGAGARRDVPWLPAIFALALALAIVEAVAARTFSHAGVSATKEGA